MNIIAMIEITNLSIKGHISNLLTFYNSYGKVVYKGQYIEHIDNFADEFKDIIGKLYNRFKKYDDFLPTDYQTLLFLKSEEGSIVFTKLLGEELYKDLMNHIKEGEEHEKSITVPFEEYYK